MGTLVNKIQPQTSNIPITGLQQTMTQEVVTYTIGIPYIPPLNENIQMQQNASLVQETSSKTIENVQVGQMQTQSSKSKQATITPQVDIPTYTLLIMTNTQQG